MSRRAAKKISRSKPKAPSVTRAQPWKDKLSIWAWLVLPLVAVVMLVIGVHKGQWSQSIDNRLAAWKNAYQIDSTTIDRFRQMEMEFHGSGNPFTSPIAHNTEEIRVHHAQMGALIPDGKRTTFLHDMETGRWGH